MGLPLNYNLSTTCFRGFAVVDLLVGCNYADCNAAERTAADFYSTWCSHCLFSFMFATDCVVRLTSHSEFPDFSLIEPAALRFLSTALLVFFQLGSHSQLFSWVSRVCLGSLGFLSGMSLVSVVFHLSFSQCSGIVVVVSIVMRFASISELPFPVLSLAIPPLLFPSLASSLSPLTLLAFVCAVVSAIISGSVVFPGFGAVNYVFVALLLSDVVSLLLLLLLSCCCLLFSRLSLLCLCILW